MSKLAFRQLSHIALNVSDIEASLKFYQNILGFQIVFRQELPAGMGRVAGLHIPDVMAIELIQLAGPDGESKKVDTTEQCTRIVLSVEDIAAAKSTLENSGVKDLSEMELDGIEMLFFPDPDNRSIELCKFPDNTFSLAEFQSSSQT